MHPHAMPIRAAAIVALVVGGGCAGSSPAQRPTATRLTVVYAVGWGTNPGRCPRGAACSVRTTRMNPSLPVDVARLTLSCHPAGGTYPSPRRACAAAADLIRLTRHPQADPCACPGTVFPDRLTGRYRDRRVSLSVAPCVACLGGRASADLAILVPRN
jgi:hypothetical protein